MLELTEFFKPVVNVLRALIEVDNMQEQITNESREMEILRINKKCLRSKTL